MLQVIMEHESVESLQLQTGRLLCNFSSSHPASICSYPSSLNWQSANLVDFGVKSTCCITPLSFPCKERVINEPVKVQDFRKSTHHFRGIYGIHLKVIKRNPKMSTCNRIGLGNTTISTDYTPKVFPDTAWDLPWRWLVLLNVMNNELPSDKRSWNIAILWPPFRFWHW